MFRSKTVTLFTHFTEFCFPTTDNLLRLILGFRETLHDALWNASFDGMQPNFVLLSHIDFLGFYVVHSSSFWFLDHLVSQGHGAEYLADMHLGAILSALVDVMSRSSPGGNPF